ncbi:hypothetical protein BDF14DRAFT_1780010, partial [Spinellus fusiger]
MLLFKEFFSPESTLRIGSGESQLFFLFYLYIEFTFFSITLCTTLSLVILSLLSSIYLLTYFLIEAYFLSRLT